MLLLEVFPGKPAGGIQALGAFELLLSPDLKEMQRSSEEDLRLLPDTCDPEGYLLKRTVT